MDDPGSCTYMDPIWILGPAQTPGSADNTPNEQGGGGAGAGASHAGGGAGAGQACIPSIPHPAWILGAAQTPGSYIPGTCMGPAHILDPVWILESS